MDTFEATNSLAERVGARLRELRKARGMSLTEFSKQSGVSVSYLSAIETGRNLPSLQIMAQITETLGVSIPAVLAKEGSPYVVRARVPEEPRTVEASHPQLHLQTAISRFAKGDVPEVPVVLTNRELFVFVQSGLLQVEVDGETIVLGTGDAADLRHPNEVVVRALEESVVIWSSCPQRDNH